MSQWGAAIDHLVLWGRKAELQHVYNLLPGVKSTNALSIWFHCRHLQADCMVSSLAGLRCSSCGASLPVNAGAQETKEESSVCPAV